MSNINSWRTHGYLQEISNIIDEDIKVVINYTYGGFSLTPEMIEYLEENYGVKVSMFSFSNDRANPMLVEVVEKLEPEHLCVEEVTVEDAFRAYLHIYDGMEDIRYKDSASGEETLLSYLIQED